MRTWTENEISLLRENYNTATNTELQAIFPNKSSLAIYKKAYKLGLRKSQDIEFRNRSEAKSGENAYNWNGGRKLTPKGYAQVLVPGHRRADKNGYVMEHIVVFEKATGITIPENCCIHHLNGNKSDNRIQNLCMMQHTAHTVFHHTGLKKTKH